MSIQLRYRRESASFLSSFVGAQAELLIDTTNNRVQVHDGVKPGGWPAARLVETQTIGRSLVSDSNYNILASDVQISLTRITQNRMFTLPTASSYPVGRVLRIVDESGSLSSSLSLTIQASVGDNLVPSAPVIMQTAFGSVALVSNGVKQWLLVQSYSTALANISSLSINTGIDNNNPLSATLNNVLFNNKSSANGGTGDIRVALNKQSAANTASFLFQDNFTGCAEIGLCGDDAFHFKVASAGSWKDALVLNANSGLMIANYGMQTAQINNGPLAGCRNRITNGNFAINQRGYKSGISLPAGAYGFDRWKAGNAGAVLTFTAGVQDTMVTITSGTLMQVIEGIHIEGGSYLLSWSGSARARMYLGSSSSAAFSSSPLVVSGITAGNPLTVESQAGTLGLVQCEQGNVATFFERRPVSLERLLCMRYFQSSYDLGTAPGTANVTPALVNMVYGTNVSNALIANIIFQTPMRVAPIVTCYSPKSGAASVFYRSASAVDAPAVIAFVTTTSCVMQSAAILNSEMVQAHYSLQAEL